MKKELLTVFLLIATIVANGASPNALRKSDSSVDIVDNNNSVTIDTLMYSLGNQYTISFMAGENDLMRSEKDFKDYIRALEDYLLGINDSSYIMSYDLGVMQGRYWIDGLPIKELKTDLPCIAKGLRMVADGSIILPDDTVKAVSVINRYSSVTANELEGDERCDYLTAVGIMKAFATDLLTYVNDLAPGKGLLFNQKAFASGMADLFEGATAIIPDNAYEFGKMVARAARCGWGVRGAIYKNSFVAGAKAALRLGEELIPRDFAEEVVLKQMNGGREQAKGDENNSNFLEKLKDYLNQLDKKVDLGTIYTVNWCVKASPVASVNTSAAKTFEQFRQENLLDAAVVSGELMIVVPDEPGLFDHISSVIHKYPLANGFKWFCGHNWANELTVGIAATDDSFDAVVHKAAFGYDLKLTWGYDNETDARRWAQFTGNNIGKNVAIVINDQFIMVQKVNSQVMSGVCAASDVLPDTVNNLFREAVPIGNENSDETIVIE